MQLRSSRARLALLGALYFAEGLPFGFQAKALPWYLREHGVSLSAIGLIGLLQLPWLLKFLWAPAVEAWGGGRFGRRKSWILPTQALLVAASVAAALVPLSSTLAFAAILLAMNFLAATQDIAVDGLAVDLLAPGELGGGNAAQVAGYKVGMLASGGLLVVTAAALDSPAVIFAGMAALLGVVLVATALLDEPAAVRGRAGRAPAERISARDVIRALGRAARAPGVGGLLVLIVGYKLGESMVDAMFTPFLRDSGFSLARVAAWSFTGGTIVSIVGSVAGGAVAARLPLGDALRLTAALRVRPLAALTAIALGTPSWGEVVAISLAEEFFGGALTTVMFALMMARVDRTIGAAHYTALACLEVGGKALGRLPAGFIADAAGYVTVFAIGTALSVVFVVAAWRVLQKRAGS